MRIERCRLLASCLALGLAILPGRTLADDDEAFAESWSRSLFPLPAGQAELRGGAALVQPLSPSAVGPWAAPIISARLGVSDRLQLAFPLFLSATLTRGSQADPTIVLSGGLQGFAWSSLTGVSVAPRLEVSGHWQAGAWAGVLMLGAQTGFLSTSTTDTYVTLGVGGSLARRVSQRVSLAVAASASSLVRGAFGQSAPAPSQGGFGALFLSPVAFAPTVRVALLPSLAVEGGMSASVDLRTGGVTLFLSLSLAWAPRLWGKTAVARD